MGWIADGERDPKIGVKHWHFVKPETHYLVTDREVTARVAELAAAGLAEIPEPDEFNTSMVRLTTDGQQYLDTYGKSQ